MENLSKNNEAFHVFLTYSGLLILKMFGLALFTGTLRYKNNVRFDGNIVGGNLKFELFSRPTKTEKIWRLVD
jgi:hypothetical protein